MLLIQLTGLSGSGKTTIAKGVKEQLVRKGYPVEIIDGDEYRKTLCRDLGFSRTDREENIRRLGIVANLLTSHWVITILSAINPYESVRQEITAYGQHVRTVWVNCDLPTLIERDTKGLYARALLPEGHPERIANLSGINDPYEPPQDPHLTFDTGNETADKSISRLTTYIEESIRTSGNHDSLIPANFDLSSFTR